MDQGYIFYSESEDEELLGSLGAICIYLWQQDGRTYGFMDKHTFTLYFRSCTNALYSLAKNYAAIFSVLDQNSVLYIFRQSKYNFVIPELIFR